MPNIVGVPHHLDPDTPCGCCKSRAKHEKKELKRKAEEAKSIQRAREVVDSMKRKGYTDYEIDMALQAIRDADRLKR